MNRIFYLSILFCCLYSFALGQATYVTTYPTSNLNKVNFEFSGEKWYFIDHTATPNIIQFYNPDNSFWKTIVMPASVPFARSPFFFSEGLFNSDGLVEFTTHIEGYDPYTGMSIDTLFILQEGGTILQMFPYPPGFGISSRINLYRFAGDDYKLTVGSSNTTTEVYDLPGRLPCDSCSNGVVTSSTVPISGGVESGRVFNYPNPATEYTKVSYQLPLGINQGELLIFDLEGKEVKRFTVDRMFDHLKINTRVMAAGTYTYHLVTSEGIIPGEKMIIIK